MRSENNVAVIIDGFNYRVEGGPPTVINTSEYLQLPIKLQCLINHIKCRDNFTMDRKFMQISRQCLLYSRGQRYLF